LHAQQERLTDLVDRLGEGQPAILESPRIATTQARRQPNAGTIERRPPTVARKPQRKAAPIERKVGSTGFSRRKGRVNWPLRGRLQASFGSRNEAGLPRDGVLIAAEPGAEVRAIHAGQVVFAEWMRGLGLLMIVDHGDGFLSLYGHNQGFLREVGDMVEAGEPIAMVGDSGGRSSAALYFGIRQKGTAVNPAQWCKKTTGKRVG
jgi:septal ring factor EnvC (AmiA/AmiB activator)